MVLFNRDIEFGVFVWNSAKEAENIRKHGVDFVTACKAFSDPGRRIYTDSKHTDKEERYFCIGKVKNIILTVRFTYREGRIRIFGAGYWRKGREYYEKNE